MANNSLCSLKKTVARNIYILSGRKPWSRGYNKAKFDLIGKVLRDADTMEKFRASGQLPQGFGCRFDERVVEYPWTLARLADIPARLLDAGSVFNFEEIVAHPKISNKDLTIFTLAPEYQAFWQKGISYHFGDMRRLPFKDEWFDEICSLSTLGHIGMDNKNYKPGETPEFIELEAGEAVRELLRVLRPGGKLLISVVYGKRQMIEWNGTPFAEQFDRGLLDELLRLFASCQKTSTAFYRYTKAGWNASSQDECEGLEYFNIHTTPQFDSDFAAAARAVALIEVIK